MAELGYFQIGCKKYRYYRYRISCKNNTTIFFLLSHFHLVFLPTTLALLPPGVMLLNHSTAPRDSAIDIKKTSQKGAPERERPNRSVVKIGNLTF